MKTKTRKQIRKTIAQQVDTVLCRWFAKCDRLATGTTPHPVLGDVPTCDRCHSFGSAGLQRPAGDRR